jgi:hypothetical protein
MQAIKSIVGISFDSFPEEYVVGSQPLKRIVRGAKLVAGLPAVVKENRRRDWLILTVRIVVCSVQEDKIVRSRPGRVAVRGRSPGFLNTLHHDKDGWLGNYVSFYSLLIRLNVWCAQTC